MVLVHWIKSYLKMDDVCSAGLDIRVSVVSPRGQCWALNCLICTLMMFVLSCRN